MGGGRAAIAQDAPPPPVAPPATVPATTAPADAPVAKAATPGAPTEPTDADLALFKRAVTRIRTAKSVAVKSELAMSGVSGGMTIAYKQSITVMGAFPDKFRAEIAVLNQDGTPGARYLVVGDGLKAWTFRPGTNQYRVRSLSAFRAANDDMPSLGILCGLVSSVPEFGDLAVLKLGGGTVQVSDDAASGAKTFHIGMGKGGPLMAFAVDPQTAAFTRLSLNGKDAGSTFDITETVSEFSVTPQSAAGIFVWSPPKGAAKVAALPIGPF